MRAYGGYPCIFLNLHMSHLSIDVIIIVLILISREKTRLERKKVPVEVFEFSSISTPSTTTGLVSSRRLLVINNLPNRNCVCYLLGSVYF